MRAVERATEITSAATTGAADRHADRRAEHAPHDARAEAQLRRRTALEADFAARLEPRRPEVGAAEPLPRHLGRRGDLVLVGDEHRAARGLEALRPAWPPGAGSRRA